MIGNSGFFAFASGLLLMIYVLVVENIYAPLQSEISGDLLLSPWRCALISSVYLLSCAIFKIPAGLLVDRQGVSRVIPGAVLFTGFSVWLFSSASGFIPLLVGRVLMGISASSILPGVAFVARRSFPPALFVMLIGFVQMTEGIGGLLGVVGGNAAENNLGWRTTLLWTALLSLPLALLGWIAFPKHRFGGVSQSQPQSSLGLANLILILRLPQVWLGFFIFAAGSGTFCGLAGLWNIRLAEEWGWDESSAVLIGASLFIGAAAGSPFFGWLAMRRGGRFSLMSGLSLSLAALLFWVWVPVNWSLGFDIINTFLIGFGIMAVVSAFEIASHGIPEQGIATVSAFVNLGALLAGAFLEFIPGLVAELPLGSQLFRLQLAHGIFSLVILAALLISRLLPKGRKLGE